MIIIGDVHGLTFQLSQKLKNYDIENIKIIQLGDFGFQKTHDWWIENMNTEIHKINFGNHDYFPYLNKSYSLGRFNFTFIEGLFTVAGATSIDKYLRTEGIDYFREEDQIKFEQVNKLLDSYERIKPRFVITHDCPSFIREKLFSIYDKQPIPTLLNEMFKIHQPDFWVFGHHHRSKQIKIDKTQFICLGELEFLEIRV